MQTPEPSVLLTLLLVSWDDLQLVASPLCCFPAGLHPKQGRGPRLTSHAIRNRCLFALSLCSLERYVVVDITRTGNSVSLEMELPSEFFVQLFIDKVEIRLHSSIGDK